MVVDVFLELLGVLAIRPSSAGAIEVVVLNIAEISAIVKKQRTIVRCVILPLFFKFGPRVIISQHAPAEEHKEKE